MDPEEPSIINRFIDILLPIVPIVPIIFVIFAVIDRIGKFYANKEAKFLKELEDEKSLQNHHLKFKRLSSRKRRSRYTARLRWALGALSRFFGPHAFSAKSYELCFRWAFIYPIMLGLLFWLISNQDISGFGLFPSIEEGRFWKAPLIFISIAGMIYSFYKYNKVDGLKRLIWLAVTVTVAFAVAVVFAGTDAGTDADTVAVAVALAVAGTVTGAVTVAVAGAGAVAFAFAVAGAGAFAVAGAFAFTILIAYDYFLKKGNRLLFYILYFSFLVACIAVFLVQPWIQVNEFSFGILLFLVVLPIINSILDFLSLGVTRLLLKKSLTASGRVEKALYYSLDLATALLSLLVLIFSLFVAIKAMEWAAGLSALEQPTYDLDALWERIESRSVWQTLFSSDGWVFIMIFSTFLPSLIHGLAFGGFLLTITQPDSSKMRDFKNWTAPDHKLALKEKNEIAGYLARRSIANVAFPIIGVVLLAGVIVVLLNFFWNIEDIVTCLIEIFESDGS